MPQPSIVHVPVKKVTAGAAADERDALAVEEPLEIRLEYTQGSRQTHKTISVTMRTPGQDAELAVGFLYTEGIVKTAADIATVKDVRENVVMVSLSSSVQPQLGSLERNFYTTSSCGVCGKASIEAVHVACNILDTKDELRLPAQLLYQLPERLREQQRVFESTGGATCVCPV